ncbi:MAG: FeoB-associated Cys-rich membrane protein [Negativicutes bacterium]|jgi:hypothetical protein
MENIIVSGIGVAAAGYIAYVIWRNTSGKGGCACGNSCSCKTTEKNAACCNGLKNLSK